MLSVYNTQANTSRKITWAIIIFSIIITLALVIFLSIFFTLRPTEPTFILQNTTILILNISTTSLLTTSFQVSFYSRNPNGKFSIFYDSLDVYATYGDQKMTFKTSLPPKYQGSKDTNIWTAYIAGNSIPINPYDAMALTQTAGVIMLTFNIDGRMRWKTGTLITGTHHISVRCPKLINLGNPVAVGEDFVSCTIRLT